MQNLRLLPAIFVTIIITGCARPERAELREIKNISAGWRFIRDTTGTGLFGKEIDDSEWEEIWLPHTPKIEPLVVNDQWRDIAWYRKHINLQKLANKKIFIEFEGAMQEADIWINNTHIANHKGGYLPFIIDITNKALKGENVITVRLSNLEDQQIPPGKPPEDLDFNMFGGIYRNVNLIITNGVYITDPTLVEEKRFGGILVGYDSISESLARLTINSQVKNDLPKSAKVSVKHIIRDQSGESIAETETREYNIEGGYDREYEAKLEVANPKLWHPEHPTLYTLETLVISEGIETDRVKTRIGLRDFSLTDKGFFLNHKKYFINGTNRHQEYPYIGYALSDEAQYRDALKIKNAGFDFVRVSHYPQSKAFMDACDELGLIVMNCIPGWQFIGDFVFIANSLDDCRKLVRRDRNHASMAFWELSLNETLMPDEYMEAANQILDEELGEKAISAGWIDYPAYDLFIPARQHAEPPHYWNQYKDGKRNIFIAEYGDWEYYAQNAGFNQTEFTDLKQEERTSRQLRGFGEKRLLQQVLNYQEAVNSNLKGNSTIGMANWLMFDYNRGYADDIEASGIADIFRIPKFAYYFYQSQRSPLKLSIPGVESGPMVYIATYWQDNPSDKIRIFSNCEEVVLYLNDTLITVKKCDIDVNSTYLKYPPFTFKLEGFTPGTLKAVGFIDKHEVAVHEVKTPKDPVKIILAIDESNKSISRSGKDYVFVYASVVDTNGTLCPINDLDIDFSVTGNAKLVGKNPMQSEAGIATILLETLPESENITLSAKGESLTEGKLQIR